MDSSKLLLFMCKYFKALNSTSLIFIGLHLADNVDLNIVLTYQWNLMRKVLNQHKGDPVQFWWVKQYQCKQRAPSAGHIGQQQWSHWRFVISGCSKPLAITLNVLSSVNHVPPNFTQFSEESYNYTYKQGYEVSANVNKHDNSSYRSIIVQRSNTT